MQAPTGYAIIHSLGLAIHNKGKKIYKYIDDKFIEIPIIRHKHYPLKYILFNNTIVYVDRLVLLAFVGEPPTPAHKPWHINGKTLDSRASNLRWQVLGDRLFCKLERAY